MIIIEGIVAIVIGVGMAAYLFEKRINKMK